MARMIAMRDLAKAIAYAGTMPVRDGARVAAIELEIAALTASLPFDDAFWSMRLRYPDPPRIPFLARWRRTRRRRAGVGVTRILLRWAPAHLDALIDGRPVARFDIASQGASSDEQQAGHPVSQSA